jgi:HK97 family phage major capsid protein
MSTSVLTKEFERLATENAQLLHTEAGEGKSLAESKEKADQFEANLTRLQEIKSLLESEKEFGVLMAWSETPERRSSAFAAGGAPEPEPGARRRGPSAGAQLVNNAEFKAWLAHLAPDGRLSNGTPVNSKKFPVNTLITGGDAASGGAFFQTDHTGLYAPYIRPALTVRDLVLNQITDADVVDFTQAVTHANAAAETAEAANANDGAISGASPGPYTVATPSGLKPEGAFTWVVVTKTVQPIAEGVPITRRALMNGGQLMGIVDDQLRYDIERRLNGQMLEGNGTDPNFRGIRNTAGITTQSFSNNVIETLRKGKTKVSSPTTGSAKVPNGAAITPENLETLDLFRVGGSTTTDGNFLLDPYTDRPARLWGMNLVEEAGLAANHAVVGYFRDAVLWDRQQATVQAYEQHKDFAARNLVYLLGEWWGTFGVLQPKSFCDCTMA